MAKINKEWPWPGNIGSVGTYPEEIKTLQKLEKNPEASPLADAEPAEFLTPKKSSDHLRMGQPMPDEEITARSLAHVLFRRVLMKRRKRGWRLFDTAVEEEELDDLPPNRREQMRSMLAREKAMLGILERYNSLAEAVYARLLSEAKG